MLSRVLELYLTRSEFYLGLVGQHLKIAGIAIVISIVVGVGIGVLIYMHCTDAPCVAACPTGCLRKDEETGLTVYDNSVCIGCHSCLMACPFEAPSFTAAGKMVKCDGCIERQRHGLLPACVRVCPFDALKMVDAETPEDNNWERTMERLDEPEQ